MTHVPRTVRGGGISHKRGAVLDNDLKNRRPTRGEAASGRIRKGGRRENRGRGEAKSHFLTEAAR